MRDFLLLCCLALLLAGCGGGGSSDNGNNAGNSTGNNNANPFSLQLTGTQARDAQTGQPVTLRAIDVKSAQLRETR